MRVPIPSFFAKIARKSFKIDNLRHRQWWASEAHGRSSNRRLDWCFSNWDLLCIQEIKLAFPGGIGRRSEQQSVVYKQEPFKGFRNSKTSFNLEVSAGMNGKEENFKSPARYAAHLSEFYPLVNGESHGQMSNKEDMHTPDRRSYLEEPITPRSQMHTRRTSSVASGVSSISDIQSFVTKRDVKLTSDALKELHETSYRFSKALNSVATEANAMAKSLESIARLKGCGDDIAQNLLSAGGLFYLVGNHDLIMANYLDEYLGENLLKDIDEFKVDSKTLENSFKAKSKSETVKLRLQEKHNRQLGKRKIRNLLAYRESLLSLQNTLDDLETLKHNYYVDSYELVESTCSKVLGKVASLSRAQLEISENIARKGWAGGGLDNLLQVSDDQYNKDTMETEEEQDNPTAAQPTFTKTQSDNGGRASLSPSQTGLRSPIKAIQEGSIKTNDQSSLLRGDESQDQETQNSIDRESENNYDVTENSFSLPPTRKDDLEDAGSSENILSGLDKLKIDEED